MCHESVVLTENVVTERWDGRTIVECDNDFIASCAIRECRRCRLAGGLEEDIADEAVVLLIEAGKIEGTNRKAAIGSYVRAAANRVASSFGRGRPGRRRPSERLMIRLDEADAAQTPTVEVEAKPDPGVDIVDCRDFLDALKPDDAQVLWLWAKHDLTQTEIAERLGLTRPTAGRRFRAALEAARRFSGAAAV